MIEDLISTKLKSVFGLSKVTFDLPGESLEQDCLFIDLNTSHLNVKDGQFTGRVEGEAKVYTQRSKMPIGYFAKCIAKHGQGDAKQFFFYDIEETTKTFQNLVERSFGFIFFFDSQYDPEVGTINTINIQRVSE